MSCQICFEDSVKIARVAELGGALCRRSCQARVCVLCLARHIEVSLDSFYPGVLPTIRCPICLLPMRLTHWTLALSSSNLTAKKLGNLRAKYETLCKQACALTPPCCHKDGYTHLPKRNINYTQYKHELTLLPSKVVDYRRIVARFCGHRVEAHEVLDFSERNFGIAATRELVERTLRRISDSERRARLMLAFVYRFPQIETRCCGFDICFNCKRIGHHEKCDDFEEAVDEEQCLVRCRECRVMLMKVQGCDSVDCVCGFRMTWSREVELRTLHKRKELPVDIYDKAAVCTYLFVKERAYDVRRELAVKLEQMRWDRLNEWLHKYKRVMVRMVERWVWRGRYSRIVCLDLPAKYKEIRKQHAIVWVLTYKNVLFRTVERWLWRHRFSLLLSSFQSELFWMTYHREHPSEVASIREEENALFAIEV